MKNMTTRWFAATCLVALAVMAGGCNGDDNAATASGENAASAPEQDSTPGTQLTGELSVWAMGAEAEALPDLVAEFTSEHPDVTVDVEPIPWDVAHDRILTSIAGGGTPDVVQLGTTWMGEFAETGALAAVPEDVNAEAFFEGPWSTAVVDGTAYGVPWYTDTRVLYYRSDLLAEAGIDEPPSTWEELQSAAAALQQDAGTRYGINLSPDNWQELLPFFFQAGGTVDLNEQGSLDLDTPEMVEALEMYDSFFEDGTAAEPVADFDVTPAFVNGTHPMFFSGPWHVGLLNDAAGDEIDWGVAQMPEKETRESFVGGSNLGVFGDTENPDVAWELVRWLSTPEVQQQWYRDTGVLPTTPEAWEGGELAEDERLAVFGDQLEATQAPPAIPEWEEIASGINAILERVTVGGLSSEEGAAEMQAHADSVLG